MNKVVYVKFNQDSFTNYTYKEYAFLCDIEDIEQDDYVLVDTARGYQVAKVIRVGEENKEATRWVVCNLTDTIDDFADKMDKMERKQNIVELIKARYEEITGIDIYRTAIPLDDKLKKLFEEYDKLDK